SGQKGYVHVKSFRYKEFRRLCCSTLTRRIRIEIENHLRREAPEQLRLLRGQRSTAGGDHRLKTGLIHLREVEVSLDQHREPSLPDCGLAEIQAVQSAALHVNRGFRRVQVLRLLVGVNRSSAECDHRAGLPRAGSQSSRGARGT